MNTEKTEPSLMEKVELMRALIAVIQGGFGKEVYALAEAKMKKLLNEL